MVATTVATSTRQRGGGALCSDPRGARGGLAGRCRAVEDLGLARQSPLGGGRLVDGAAPQFIPSLFEAGFLHKRYQDLKGKHFK